MIASYQLGEEIEVGKRAMSLTSILLWIFLLPFESLAQVRLSGGSEAAGRVEVFLNGEWGTVCKDNWDIMDATVVCRQLGFPAVLDVFKRVDGGQGIIHLDEVTCNGDESSLLDCPRSNLPHDCTHREDVGIACLPVRLADGNTTAGRIEVYLNGQWGTVCDDSWDPIDAVVVCRQLGFKTASLAFSSGKFDGGLGPIHINEVKCYGHERSVLLCEFTSQHNCDHSRDVSVNCVAYDNYEVRLAGGNRVAGRVEIYLNGQWGTVCDDVWDLFDAKVVCRQLGFQTASRAFHDASFGGGTGPIHIDDVECKGNETSLLLCSFTSKHNCQHTEDAGASCVPYVRLHEGNKTTGRVEVLLGDQWGTVCDDHWDIVDATVVCRQLGFKTAIQAFRFGDSVEDTIPIHVDDVDCEGGEISILDCDFTSRHNCEHSEDAGASCLPYGNSSPTLTTSGSPSTVVTQETRSCSPIGKVRLSGGNDTAGRVEICVDEEWGTVCDDEWDLVDAYVVCRELGYRKASAALPDASFGEGSGHIHLDESRCFGNETSLLSCNHSRRPNCQHKEDASVICEPFVKGEIRLAGGNLSAGRVEVYLDDQWGTVCDDDWDIDDADVVCRNIGFKGALSAPKSAAFGEGEGPIHLDSVKCAGDEHSLLACEYKSNPDCEHHEDSSVVCQTTQEMDKISKVPLILSMCICAVIIGAVVATIAHFDLRRKQKNKVESENDKLSTNLRPLPDAPVKTTCDNFVETLVLENCKKPEKEDKTESLTRMSKGERVSNSSNYYMTVIEPGNNDIVNYERMNSVKELECNVTTEIK